ncbi:MAG TPA: Rrf2 family transcriptional regulator [Tepiditoga sp.]|nr:Rrf2 family transcriptional regulator [Tepiditoga sp.]
MGLTVKSSYALRALYELSVMNAEGIKKVSIAELAKRQDIPRDFLEKIFSELREANILKSIRGRYGGYILMKKPKDLRLSEIVNILDKPLQSYECISGDCSFEIQCAVDFVWKRVHNVMMMELDKMTLQDIIDYGNRIAVINGGKTIEQ